MTRLLDLQEMSSCIFSEKKKKKKNQNIVCSSCLPLSCWTRIYPAIANSVDPDQLASEEANWSGSALFAIKYVNL